MSASLSAWLPSVWLARGFVYPGVPDRKWLADMRTRDVDLAYGLSQL